MDTGPGIDGVQQIVKYNISKWNESTGKPSNYPPTFPVLDEDNNPTGWFKRYIMLDLHWNYGTPGNEFGEGPVLFDSIHPNTSDLLNLQVFPNLKAGIFPDFTHS